MTDSPPNFDNLYWLGGSPCAGKTSISEIIATRFGLDLYHVDEAFELHSQHFDPAHHPTLTKWSASSWNQRWMQPVDTLVQDAIACYQEHFTFILEDLSSIANRKPLLVEGTALLPRQVTKVLSNYSRAIWLIPTPDFQGAHYAKRDWARDIVAQCSNPNLAFDNWMERDIRFAKWIETEANALHLPLLTIDGNRTIEEYAEAVAQHFQIMETKPEMPSSALIDLLELFANAEIPVWLDGGWGVDALLETQTRTHRDVDIILPVADVPKLQALLADRGFTVREGLPPDSFVLANGSGLEVDVHAVTFDQEGNGVYRMQNGEDWIFPAEGFSGRGLVGRMRVCCLSPTTQVLCHGYGYVPKEKDFRDMELLETRFGVELPTHLRRSQASSEVF